MTFNDDGSLRCNLCNSDPCVCGKPRDPSREAFEAWWYASKYAQVVIPSRREMQIAWDAWQARSLDSGGRAQEPVAWAKFDPVDGTVMRLCMSIETEESMRADGWSPLYAAPPAPSPSVERPIVLPLLGPADLLVECAQSFVEGWTIARVQDFARAAVELDRSRR